MWGEALTHAGAAYGDFKKNNTVPLFKLGETVIESYFSPSDETNCRILDALRSTDHHIQIGLLLLTKEDLVDEIIALHQSGIHVRVIVEDEQSSSNALSRLRQAHVPVAVHDIGSIFHHKYAIIDEGFPDSDPQVITGSHNWTWSADNINDENTLIIHDQSLTNIFRQEFEARWAELNITSLVPADQGDLKIFPNPVSEYVHIENSGSSSFMVTLCDAIKRTILSSQIEPYSNSTLHFNHALPQGVYTLHLVNQQHHFTERIFVTK
jgi:phosphatidylserine/phosphatidylglycerophosphate/cardiolipin synthase-like enzyme